MINEELIKMRKVLRRSFVVPPEIDQALTQIQHTQGFSNPQKPSGSASLSPSNSCSNRCRQRPMNHYSLW